MKILTDLYRIYAPSGRERILSNYVQKYLKKRGIPFEVDEFNQIYNFQPDTPLLSAHMDQVSRHPVQRVKVRKGKITADGNLGADDKNGVWMMLKLIPKMYPKVSFIFSTEEEVGGNIEYLLSDHEHELSKIKYGLVFDRKGSGDIIGTYNDYCTQDFEDDIFALISGYGYKPAMGIWSDADALSNYISCVNLSVGYYNAHTIREYTVVKHLKRALKASFAILTNISFQYKKPNKYIRYWDNKTPTTTNQTDIDNWLRHYKKSAPPLITGSGTTSTFDDSDYSDWNQIAEMADAQGCCTCEYCGLRDSFEYFYIYEDRYVLCFECHRMFSEDDANGFPVDMRNPETCPKCGEEDNIDMSPLLIGDYICDTCGCVFDDDGRIQVDSYNEVEEMIEASLKK